MPWEGGAIRSGATQAGARGTLVASAPVCQVRPSAIAQPSSDAAKACAPDGLAEAIRYDPVLRRPPRAVPAAAERGSSFLRRAWQSRRPASDRLSPLQHARRALLQLCASRGPFGEHRDACRVLCARYHQSRWRAAAVARRALGGVHGRVEGVLLSPPVVHLGPLSFVVQAAPIDPGTTLHQARR